VGLQMGTAVSISFLYSYNLYCDQKGADMGKGMSNLCGDDSLRAGDDPYIQGYKDTANELGSLFSEWKDVTTKANVNARGIFTEIPFQDREILQIPKMKTVVRPEQEFGDDSHPPRFKTFLQASKTLKAPNDAMRTLVWEEQAFAFLPQWENVEGMLPLGMPVVLGGMGQSARPLEGKNLRVWELIRRVPNPYIGLKLVRMFTSALAPEQIQPTRRLLEIDQFTHAERLKPLYGDQQWRQGRAQWLHLQERMLRGGIESATSLVQPPLPTVFHPEKDVTGGRPDAVPHSVVTHSKNLDRLDHLLALLQQGPKTGTLPASARVKPGSYESSKMPFLAHPMSEEQFITMTMRMDIPNAIVSDILGPPMWIRETPAKE